MPKRKGFTLIELLVTISIIALLSVIAMVIYSGFTKNVRDQKRVADLKTIQSGIEEYYADQGFYPQGSTASCPATGNGSLIYNCPLTSIDGARTYVAKVPNDPSGGSTSYLYSPLPSNCDNNTVSNKCTNYCLYASLENSSNSKSESSFCPVSNPLGSNNYAVGKP